uniref:FANCI solenoid 4 domain-containing protein n=1 Tax=Trieres chinensis TaxID=1514140 RepID=A0A7S1ZUU9_TRICV
MYIRHSFLPIPADEKVLSKSHLTEIGRIGALTAIFRDALTELPNTHQSKGPVESYPTCCYQSFGSYFSSALNSLPKELETIFDSSLPKSSATVEKTLEIILHLTELLDAAFKLTKENPLYVKRPFLLTQLRAGTKFLEVFVGQAVDFLQAHFQQHENAVISIIKQTQTSTRQLGNIISHGKREKDSNLIKESPRTKKILETFVHKIKVLMRKNGCVTALWAGNLKMKHIDGSVVEDNLEPDEEDEENDVGSNEEEEDGSGTESESENEYDTDE